MKRVHLQMLAVAYATVAGVSACFAYAYPIWWGLTVYAGLMSLHYSMGQPDKEDKP